MYLLICKGCGRGVYPNEVEKRYQEGIGFHWKCFVCHTNNKFPPKRKKKSNYRSNCRNNRY